MAPSSGGKVVRDSRSSHRAKVKCGKDSGENTRTLLKGWMPEVGVDNSCLGLADRGGTRSSVSCSSSSGSSSSFLVVDGVKVREYKLFPEVKTDGSSEKTSASDGTYQGNSRVLILPGPNGSDIVVPMASLSGPKDSGVSCSCWCQQDAPVAECRSDSNVQGKAMSSQPMSTHQNDRPLFLKYSFASMVAQRPPEIKEKIGDSSDAVGSESRRANGVPKLFQGGGSVSSEWGSYRTTTASSSSWDESEDSLSIVHTGAVLEKDAEHFGCGNSFDRITWPYRNGMLRCQTEHSHETFPCAFQPRDSLSSLLADVCPCDSRPSSSSSVKSSPLLTPTSVNSVQDTLEKSGIFGSIPLDWPILGLPSFSVAPCASKSGSGSTSQKTVTTDRGAGPRPQNSQSTVRTPGEQELSPRRGDSEFWKTRPFRCHLQNGLSEPALHGTHVQGTLSPVVSPRLHHPLPPPHPPSRTLPATFQQRRILFRKAEPPPGFSVPSTTSVGVPPGLSGALQAGDCLFSGKDLVSSPASHHGTILSSPSKTVRTQERVAASNTQPFTRPPDYLPHDALVPMCCAQVGWILRKPFDKCLPPSYKDAFQEYVNSGAKLWEVWKCVLGSPPSSQDLVILARALLNKMTQDHKEAVPAQLEVVDMIFQRLSRVTREM